MERLPVAGPWITDLEVRYVTEAVTGAWYADATAPITQFEQAFARAVGRRYAISLPSCTSGLHLALAALGVGPGDEVVVPDLTWIATSAPVSYVGATPVFADVDAVTLTMTADTFLACLSPRTKAVVVVDLYGVVADLPQIIRVASEHGVAVIEDAAEALGSRRADAVAGSFGDAAVFSFHGSKTMTTGEGGMLVLDDDVLHHRVHVLRDHGRDPGDRAFDNSEVAYKYKMSGLQAALGRAQLERLEELTTRKNAIHRWYAERLVDRDDLTLYLSADPGTVWWMTSIRLDPEGGWDKDRLQAALSERGVDSRPVFRPLSSLAAYADEPTAARAREVNEVAYAESPLGLNLPSALCLTETDVDRVCAELSRILDAGAQPRSTDR